MKPLLILALSSLISIGAYAQSERDLIRDTMENPHYGKNIELKNMEGFYLGSCYDNSQVKQESLFVFEFSTVEGKHFPLAVSSLQTYDGNIRPHSFDFLLRDNSTSWSFMAQMIRQGKSGTDNNMAQVNPGEDFFYSYQTESYDKTAVIKITQFRFCEPGTVCDPPLAPMCRYGYDQQGRFTYSDCIRQNDQTVYKKVSDEVLISHRTADGWGKKTGNNMAFYLEPISTYCRWTRQSP